MRTPRPNARLFLDCSIQGSWSGCPTPLFPLLLFTALLFASGNRPEGEFFECSIQGKLCRPDTPGFNVSSPDFSQTQYEFCLRAQNTKKCLVRTFLWHLHIRILASGLRVWSRHVASTC